MRFRSVRANGNVDAAGRRGMAYADAGRFFVKEGAHRRRLIRPFGPPSPAGREKGAHTQRSGNELPDIYFEKRNPLTEHAQRKFPKVLLLQICCPGAHSQQLPWLVKTDAIARHSCYNFLMSKRSPQPAHSIDEAARERRLEMQHLQAIEGNPLTADEIAMFEMFEREGWSHERRRTHILALLQRIASPEAAE